MKKIIILLSIIIMRLNAIPGNVYLENKLDAPIMWQADYKTLHHERTLNPLNSTNIWTSSLPKISNFKLKIGPALVDMQFKFDEIYDRNDLDVTLVIRKSAMEILSGKPSNMTNAPARPSTIPKPTYHLSISNKYQTPIIITVNGTVLPELAPQSSRKLGILETISSLSIKTNRAGALNKNLKDYLADAKEQAQLTKKSGIWILNIEPSKGATWNIGTQFIPLNQ